MPFGNPVSHENSAPFLIIGFFLAAAIILPLNAVDTNPLVSINASYDTSLRPQQIKITKYPGDNSAFKIETSTGLVIITDPCDMTEEVQPDIVFVSHYHDDHADFSHLKGLYQLIDKAGNFNVKGVAITGVDGHHNRGDETVTNHIFVFELEGLRIAQFGSQGDFPTEEMFRQIGSVDILFIQIYGAIYKKLSPSQAYDIVQRVQAKLVIPQHGDRKNTDYLIDWIKGPNEKISGGQLIVSKEELDKLSKTKVVSLDVSK
jgi:L-ascorbate metabolism protein UlaG (beta-lactamase superfamily)